MAGSINCTVLVDSIGLNFDLHEGATETLEYMDCSLLALASRMAFNRRSLCEVGWTTGEDH